MSEPWPVASECRRGSPLHAGLCATGGKDPNVGVCFCYRDRNSPLSVDDVGSRPACFTRKSAQFTLLVP